MHTEPLPFHAYDDGVVKLLSGHGFTGKSTYEFFGVTEEYIDRVIDANTQATAHLCDNPTCPKHKDVLPKYENLFDEGISLVEHLSVMLHLIQPANALELASVVFVASTEFGRKQAQEESTKHSPFGGIFNALKGNSGPFTIIEGTAGSPEELMKSLSKKLGIKNKDENEALQDLLGSLKTDKDEPSAYNVGGEGKFVYAHGQREPHLSYGVDSQRYGEMIVGCQTIFDEMVDNDNVMVENIVAACYDNVLYNNQNELVMLANIVGMMTQQTFLIRHQRSLLRPQ